MLASYSKAGINNQLYSLVDFDEIIKMIKSPGASIKNRIDKIRLLADNLNKPENENQKEDMAKEIKNLKLSLPHFSMCEFKDNYRSNDNFLKTQVLLFDIDHIADINSIKEILKNDERIFCYFVSPSGQGLKVLLQLDNTISELNKYYGTYKYYAKVLSDLLKVEVDNTADPARACFVSNDSGIFVNYDCKKVSVNIPDELNATTSDNNKEYLLKKWLGVPQGQRHTELISHIGACIQMGFPEDITTITMIEWNRINIPPLDDYEIVETVEDIYGRYADEISTFFWIDENDKIHFSHIRFKRFLESKGYYKYGLSTGYALIQNIEGIIRVVEDHQLKESLIKIINDDRLKNHLIKSTSSIISKSKQDYLQSFNLEFNSNTKDKHYSYFQNGFYIVDRDKISGPYPYSDLKKVIWKSKIIQRKLQLNQDINYISKSEFYQFLNKITDEDEDRFYALITALGYLCHTYIDLSVRKAVVSYDETAPDLEGVAEGGKGKSIIGQGLRHYKMNNTWIDGSRLERIDKHTFQSVGPDTELIIIDDLVKKFDFGRLFASVTEGVTVEKKYQNPFVITNVKFFFSSNFTLGGEGSSYERRLNEIEIAPYYNNNFTPIMEFGHLLFEEWDDDQWNMFYNLMLYCVKTYLEKGLTEYQKVHINAKKIIESTSHDFYEFAKNLMINEEYDKNASWYKFKGFTDDYDMKKNKFTRWIKTYAKLSGLTYIEIPGTGNRNNSFKLIKEEKRIKTISPFGKVKRENN